MEGLVYDEDPDNRGDPPEELAYQSTVSPDPAVAVIVTVPVPHREAFPAAGAPLIFD